MGLCASRLINRRPYFSSCEKSSWLTAKVTSLFHASRGRSARRDLQLPDGREASASASKRSSVGKRLPMQTPVSVPSRCSTPGKRRKFPAENQPHRGMPVVLARRKRRNGGFGGATFMVRSCWRRRRVATPQVAASRKTASPVVMLRIPEADLALAS